MKARARFAWMKCAFKAVSLYKAGTPKEKKIAKEPLVYVQGDRYVEIRSRLGLI